MDRLKSESARGNTLFLYISASNFFSHETWVLPRGYRLTGNGGPSFSLVSHQKCCTTVSVSSCGCIEELTQ